METAVDIPNTLPLNIFGTTVVAKNAVIVPADQAITTDKQLSVDGSTYISFDQATTGTLNITLPFAVNASGALDYLQLAGQTRMIFNASIGNAGNRLQIRRVLTVDGSGNPATYSNIILLEANLLATTRPIGATLACDGSSWIVVGTSQRFALV